MAKNGGYSAAINNGGAFNSTRGASIGRNDTSVATAKDAGNDFASFLGPLPPFTGRQRAEEQFSRETWDMPDKYADEVQFLNHVLDFFIIDQADFWCSKILPWAKTDSLHFQWNVWKFDRTIADIEPHQGVPRLVTSSRSSRSSSLIRRGLAFMIEHGFYNTDQGRETFALNLKQITDAVHTTCYSDVLHSLLQCNQYYTEWNRKFGGGTRQADVLAQERRRWSIVSKSSRGLYLLDADLKREFRREGVVPNCWVWPDRMSVYLHMVPEEEVDYSRRGPGAYQALASGKVPSSFRGLPVYTSYPLDTDFNGAPISLLERNRQIGEWFYITPQDEAIAIFSAAHDDFIPITYAEALANAHVTETVARTMATEKRAVDAAKAVLAGADPADAGAIAAAEADLVAKKAALAAKGPNILIFRPFQTWRMASCLLLKAGSELGNTFHGHHDMQLQNDAIRKIMVGHYTFYSRAVVKNEKLVSVVEDVFANEYISGEGIRFFEPGDGEHSFQSHWTQQTIGTKECDRSLLAFATTMKTAEIKALPCAIDLLGDFPDQVRANISSTQTVKESKDIVKELKLAQLRPMREAESTTYLKNMMTLNTVMFRGHTKRKAKEGQFRDTNLGKGHWGANIYPGCAAHRTGQSGDGFLRHMDYKTTLE